MLPLVKKGYWVQYKMGKQTYIHRCFQSNPSTVWVEDDNGRVVKLHKLRNFIKVVEEPSISVRAVVDRMFVPDPKECTINDLKIVEDPNEGKEELGGKPQKGLDDLFDDLLSSTSS